MISLYRFLTFLQRHSCSKLRIGTALCRPHSKSIWIIIHSMPRPSSQRSLIVVDKHSIKCIAVFLWVYLLFPNQLWHRVRKTPKVHRRCPSAGTIGLAEQLLLIQKLHFVRVISVKEIHARRRGRGRAPKLWMEFSSPIVSPFSNGSQATKLHKISYWKMSEKSPLQ